MTQAIFDAPNPGNASNRDSQGSARLDPLVRTQMWGLYKSDTPVPDAAANGELRDSMLPDPFPSIPPGGFVDEAPDPFPTANARGFSHGAAAAFPNSLASSPSPEPPRNALQRTNPQQVRLIWPATLPVVPVPERDALHNLLEPARGQVPEESPWLDAVHVPRLRGAIDTSVRLTLLDRILTSKRFKPALITSVSVALLMGISLLFAFALDSEGDDYAPAESELPVKVAPKDAQATPPASNPAMPDKAAAQPAPPSAAEHAGDAHKPPVGAANVTPSRAPGSPHMATRSAPREPMRPRTSNQAARVPWWE